MINTWIGNLGHFFVIVAFVSAMMAAYGYIKVTLMQGVSLEGAGILSWKRFSRSFFLLHGVAILGVVASLFYIIYNHLFEYHYAWNHSSRNLPVQYMISCFWEGQEGSFLLWIFWQAVLGLILIRTNRFWEGSVMSIFALVQAFLVSMILGVVIFGLKIGSNPFILLRDALGNVPVFQPGSSVYDPYFVPEDGTGLNPILQNYWMVIHPPTLFLGFATTLIPFAYCLAGLWQKKYSEWIRPALPWALFSGAVLGLGILMGGYWAYETLNFGGYWNWDPVENAIYVPWLVLVAAIHTMIVHKNKNSALKTAMVLVISTFVLILYSTFLVRSGILGNASVHSFTDLGLSGQLLLYLSAFTMLAIGLAAWRWREIPTSEKELSTYSREFWIFIGATVLCLAGFQVIMTTSIPVFNSISESLGYVSNLALPVDPVAHYTKFQLWAGVLVALLSGTGQFFWWKKMDKESLYQALYLPVVIALLSSAAIIYFYQIRNWKFIVLLTVGVYSVVANSTILGSLLRKNTYKLAGGSVAHIGVAMMLLGMMFSSGYSRVISKNNSGLLYSKEFDDEQNANNILLWLNQPIKMNEYLVSYTGDYIEAAGFPHYISKKSLIALEDPFRVVAKEAIRYKQKTYFKAGDTLKIYPENTYYRVEYRDPKGRTFELFPRAQVNPKMGLIASPDIRHQWGRDLYTHVSSIPDPEQEKEWSDTQEFKVQKKDTFFLNDYVAILEEVSPLPPEELAQFTSDGGLGIKAQLKVFGRDRFYSMEPKFLIRDNMVAPVPDVSDELGLKITLMHVDPESEEFTFGVNTTQKDYIIMKALEKPMINLLWMGTIVLMMGFGLAIFRRYGEFQKMRNRGVE